MNTRRLRANGLLLTTAIVWGFAFAFQKMGADFLGAFSFNGVRFVFAVIALVPVVYFFSPSLEKGIKRLIPTKAELIAGACGGFVIYIASFFQQAGLAYTTAGKAAFISGLYLVIVPLYGLFWKQKVHVSVWAAIAMAITGMYFLTINEEFTIGGGDTVVFIGAFIWAAHIMIVDRFNPSVDPLKFSWLQFAAAAVFSLITALFVEFETLTYVNIRLAIIPLLYSGICSAGIGYTLQILGQKDARPAPAALIMSLESVFAVIGGFFILSEIMGIRESLGCALMIGGMILAQYKELVGNFAHSGASRDTQG
jgi:drug/metabolite transporter (DMT)-like permease